MNVVRKDQESKIKNLNMLGPNNKLRGRLMVLSILLTPVLAAGFATAKIKGGTSCSTYPMIGNKWMLDETNFDKSIPLLNNFVEN